jgi:hypothetical protein
VRRRECRCFCKGPRPPLLRPPWPTQTALKSPPLLHTRRQSQPLVSMVLWAALIPPGPNDPPCRRSEPPARTAPTAMEPPLQLWMCPGRSPHRYLRGRCQLPITAVPAGLQRLTPLPRSPLPLPPQPHRFQAAIRGQCARPLSRRRPSRQQQMLRSRHRSCKPLRARDPLPPTPAPPRHPSPRQPLLRQPLVRQPGQCRLWPPPPEEGSSPPQQPLPLPPRRPPPRHLRPSLRPPLPLKHRLQLWPQHLRPWLRPRRLGYLRPAPPLQQP